MRNVSASKDFKMLLPGNSCSSAQSKAIYDVNRKSVVLLVSICFIFVCKHGEICVSSIPTVYNEWETDNYAKLTVFIHSFNQMLSVNCFII